MYWRKYIFIISGAIIILLLTGCRQLLGGANDPGFITADFEYVERITVTSPSRGDFYAPGDLIEIKWLTSFSSFNKLNILLYKKSTLQRTIIENTQNTGSYFWRIPGVIDNSVHYLIKVVNSKNPGVFNYSGQFGIFSNN